MKLRIAICQLSSHPALEIGNCAVLQEPFLPSGMHRLSKLASAGLDVQELQLRCKRDYIEWQKARLAAVLNWLSPLHPDLVLFPEGSVPVEGLDAVSGWSTATRAAVLAGSHTPLGTASAQKTYGRIGVPAETVERVLRKYRANNVLPIVEAGKADLIAKHSLSPFEFSDVASGRPAVPAPRAIEVQLRAGPLMILPLICAEALQLGGPGTDHQLAGIVAFDSKPTQFTPFIEQQIANRKVVAFCNDGGFGGSRVATVRDLRVPSYLDELFPNGLPVGDAILVEEIDFDVLAVEVATARPRLPYRLLHIAEVVYADTGARAIAEEVQRIRKVQDSRQRSELLEAILHRAGIGRVQRQKISLISDKDGRGAPTDDLWDVLGDDCDLSPLGSLAALESRLAGICLSTLTNQVGNRDIERPGLLAELSGYIRECRERSPGRVGSAAQVESLGRDVVDRDEEVGRIIAFLDHAASVILEVTGLPEMGKSVTIRKAFSQSGFPSPTFVRLTETSSLEFLLASLLQSGGAVVPAAFDPVELARSDSLGVAIARQSAVVIERADLLLDGRRWRDAAASDLLLGLVHAAQLARKKLILETRHELPFDVPDVGAKWRLPVRGLAGKHAPFGARVLEAQLRRAGLPGTDLDSATKEEIVNRLGGHPKALELAGEAIYEQGLSSFLSGLRQRRGFVLNYVGKLVAGLGLDDNEQTVLRLIGLARTPLPRGVIPTVVDFPAAESVRRLIAAGAIEAAGVDTIEIAGILREYFQADQLSPDLVRRFHEEAARAYERIAALPSSSLGARIEAEFHSQVAGIAIATPSNFADGALAVAKSMLADQRYEDAARILGTLRKRRETRELLRLSAEVEARCGRFDSALLLARRVFAEDRGDTTLLADLAKIALTQSQDEAIESLLEIARTAGVEDVSLLVVEGRLALRRREYMVAERVLRRAVARTERNPWPFYYLGRTYIQLGRLEEAIDVLLEGERFFYEAEVRSRKSINAIKTQVGLLYLFDDRIDLAAPYIEAALNDEPTPEAVRAYAALTIKREGIDQAGEAMRLLGQARVRSRADRAQFHLLYGLFFLGIGNDAAAVQEFEKAHDADRSNVFIMLKYARGLYDLAMNRFAEQDDSCKGFAEQCAKLVKKILDFDVDNREGIRLAQALRAQFSL